MRWSAAALFALGLVAAICAALLVQSIRSGAAPVAELRAEDSTLAEPETEQAQPAAESRDVAASDKPAPVATGPLAGLPAGLRAVSVQRSAHAGLGELLGAGSVVDVLATLPPRARPDARPDPVSLTLLEGVRVFAVGEAHGDVTLVLDPSQAEKLVLAMKEGSVSLVLRNPADESRTNTGGTLLSSLAPVLTASPTGRQVTVTKGGVSERRTVRFDTQE